MSRVFKNSYQLTKPEEVGDINADTPEDEYDHNFMFDVVSLRSERVELRPFIVSCKSHLMSTSNAEMTALVALKVAPTGSSRCRFIVLAAHVIQDSRGREPIRRGHLP